MSLTLQQMNNTRAELKQNFELIDLSKQQIADDLNISLVKLDHIFTLTQRSLNDPWILRNYLLQKVKEEGQTPVPFTALSGDWHHYWFLNSRAIDNRKMSHGDN